MKADCDGVLMLLSVTAVTTTAMTGNEINRGCLRLSQEGGALPAGCSGILSGGVNYRSYTNWDVGVAFTWKQFTLDLRYFDTDLNKGDCNAFTSAQNARFDGSFTPINPGGFGTNWCSATFMAKLSVDLTKDNLK